MNGSLYGKLFLSSYFFTITIRKKQPEGIFNNGSFQDGYTIPATRACWFADPMLVDYKDKTYLFYEAVDRDHGRIEVAEVNEDCTLERPIVLLSDECHYSYPFVFEYKGEFYMIPESSAANEVRLYKAKFFPIEWEMVDVLLYAKAVDTTVFQKNGKMYLLTYISDGKTERVTPEAYEMSLEQKISLKKMNWNEYDTLRVRGAGGVFSIKDKQFRPAQISTEIRYGDGVAFYEVRPNEDSYTEKFADELLANNVTVKCRHADGLHTYSVSERFEAIDIRCREFDLLKVPRRILGAWK